MNFDLNADKENEQRAAHEVSGNALSLRGTIVGALLLVAFDGVAMGQGGLALLLATWVVVVRLPLLALAWKRKPLLKYRAKKTAIYLIAVSAVLGWVAFNRDLGSRRAEDVVAAVHAYATTNGRYPASLNELVPGFLPALPLVKWTLGWNRFEYRLTRSGNHWLTWTVVSPYGRRSYIFEEARWIYLD